MASKPFSAATLGPIQPLEEPKRDLVIEASRANYARKREEVETKIMDWFTDQRAVYKKDTSTEISTAPKPKTYIVPTVTPSVRNDNSKNVSNTVPKKDPLPKPPVATQPKKTIPKPEIVEETPVVLSSTMNDLLDQLEFTDTPTVIAPEVKPTPIKTPEKPKSITQTPITVQNNITVSTPVVQKEKVLEKPIKDRAAKPETKNVLMEALEKAKALKAEENAKKPLVIEKPTIDTSTLKETLQQFKKAEEPLSSIEPEKIEQPQVVIPQQPVPTTNTVREVPEDILKKLLE
jgi:hypothetical protein